MFIYKITNNINGKVYIGQTVNSINKRWNQHVCDSKTGRNTMLICRSIKKHGKENFTIEEIDGANSQSELNYREWSYVNKFNSLFPGGYNLMEGGGAKGKMSQETKDKLSKIAKSRAKNPNGKKVIDIVTGSMWESCQEASLELNINYSTLKDYLCARVHNKTNLRWLNSQDLFKEYKKCNKEVINIKTGFIYKSISEAARKEGINRITLNCKLLNPNKNNTSLRYVGE